MHDLVHDLARSVVGNHECLIVESALDIDYISEETRRLNLLVDLSDEEILPKVIEAMKKAKKLRTVFVNGFENTFDIGNAFKKNKRLRVIDLSGFLVATETTSSSIGGLKHLRYLDVKGFFFPKGIRRLRLLETLSNFGVGDKKKNKNACGIEEFEDLNLLSEDLFITHLQNVTSGTDASRANLKEKKNLRGLEELRPHPHLRTLAIEGFQGSNITRWIQKDSSCLPNLVELTLSNNNCEQFAGFGALPSLRSLTLESLYNLKCIGNEFYYSASSESTATTTIAFQSLKKFILVNMKSLEEWVVPAPHASTTTTTGATTAYCFPLLEEINIWGCPKLSTITPTTTIFPSLKVLILRNIDGSAAVETLVTNNLNSLTFLTLCYIPNLITLPHQGLMENNNTLLSLSIEGCYEFKGFFRPNNGGRAGGGGQLVSSSSCSSSSSSSSSLQSLRLYFCPALRFYPNILRSLTSLRSLEIQECKESSSLQDELTSLSSSLEHLEHVLLRN